MRWRAAEGGAAYGVVGHAEAGGRQIRVEFPGGFLFFAPATDSLERVVFGEGAVVRALDDGRTGRVTGRREKNGLVEYQVAFSDDSSRLLPEATLRPEAIMQAADEAAAKSKRLEAEAAAKAAAALEARQRRERGQAEATAAARAAAEEAARLRAERRAVQLQRVQDAFELDFLGADLVYKHLEDAQIDPVEYERLQATFVKDWAKRHLRDSLDPEQAAAVAAHGGDVKVVARAGSGKTRTLTARAIFLQKHCRVSPQEMLLLAFNRKAADQMKDRLRASLGDDLPHVMTFHALAYANVHPEEDLLFDDRDADQLGLSREIQRVIDEHIRSDQHYQAIRDIMLGHFRDDWERIVDHGVRLSISEFVAYRRSLPRESLRGEYVKSFGERLIANTLFENSVSYHYERNERWNGINYRPDFMIFNSGGNVVIEYFGLEGDPDYDQMSEAKRRYWAQRPGWTLLEYSPADLARLGVDGFQQQLIADLVRLGIEVRQKTEEEIWQEVRPRAIDHFTETMTAFIGRCRKRNLSVEQLDDMIAGHQPNTASPNEARFTSVARSIYCSYLERLAVLGQEDFDGLIWRAAANISAGNTRFARDHGRETGDLANLRFVLVDEFQDFSSMFAALLQGIRSANPSAEFFCVGDDWQAINGFAGADLGFFRDFGSPFRDGRVRTIATNYRSAATMVRLGNAVMRDRGEPAVPRTDAPEGEAYVCLLDTFAPSAFEKERHEGDELTPAVLRLVCLFLNRGLDVVLLSRRNSIRGYVKYRDDSASSGGRLDRFLRHIRSFLPEEDRKRVTISTTHRYKGLEKPAVIVLDGFASSYPLIHPAWVFLRLFGDTLATLEDEERRLFYVAVTRAQDSLAIITEKKRATPFLSGIPRGAGGVRTLDWSGVPSLSSAEDSRVEVRVSGFRARDQLKARGFSYEPIGRMWRRTFPERGFSLGDILDQAWASDCDENRCSRHDGCCHGESAVPS